ncbi:MAG: pyruvate dehydrogenase (acetyl-transferring) E1 component subunit alpha, partial [Chloroflexi bacterium]
PERYRSSEEIKKWQDGDPITALRKIIVSKRMGLEADLDALDQEVEVEIAAAVQFAEESPEPADEALWQHVYSQSPNGRA